MWLPKPKSSILDQVTDDPADTPAQIFGRNFRAVVDDLKRHGSTEDELKKGLKKVLSDDMYDRCKRGEYAPGEARIRAIARILKIDPERLVKNLPPTG